MLTRVAFAVVSWLGDRIADHQDRQGDDEGGQLVVVSAVRLRSRSIAFACASLYLPTCTPYLRTSSRVVGRRDVLFIRPDRN
jgi:hypothetical protein